MLILEANRDSQWLSLAKVLVDVATENSEILSLSPAQASGLANTYAAFETAFNNLEAQKALKDAATETKDQTRDSLEALVRKYSKQWRGTVTVPDALLTQMNLAPHSPDRTFSAPTPVLQLTATTSAVGQVFLKFKRNGNIQGTTFWIQAKTEGATEWSTVMTSSKAKVTLDGFNPGVPAWFRVISVRREILSAPSESVSIYSNGEESSLTIAA